MDRIKSPTWRAILTGALYYGGGAVAGALISYLLLRLRVFDFLFFWVPEGQPLVKLLVGLIYILIMIGLGGGLAGALGGQALARIDPLYTRRKYIWRSSLAMGLTLGLLSILLILLTALVALYNPGSTREPWAFIVLFAIYGLLYGLISGLILGFSTVRFVDSWRVILASLAGFTLGGAFFGYGMWRIFLTTTRLEDQAASLIFLLVLWSLMYALGGAFLGWAFHSISARRLVARSQLVPLRPVFRWAFIVAGILLVLILLSDFRQLLDFVTVRPGSLSAPLPIHTVGVQWAVSMPVTSEIGEVESGYDLATGASLRAAVWVAEAGGSQDVFFSWILDGSAAGEIEVQPINVSNSLAPSLHPQVVIDSGGLAHVVWSEAGEAGAQVLYSRCDASACATPLPLSNALSQACSKGTGQHDYPAIAVDTQDILMVAWDAGGSIPYLTWLATESLPSTPAACLPGVPVQPEGPLLVRLAGGDNGEFSLAFQASGTAYSTTFSGGQWSIEPQPLGPGEAPEAYADPQNGFHFAWCGPGQTVQYQPRGGPLETLAFPPCLSRPALVQDADGLMHLLWYSDQAQTMYGNTNSGQFLYESLRTAQGWSEPAIVERTRAQSQPVVAGLSAGDISMLSINDLAGERTLAFATQPHYQCSPEDLSPLGKVVVQVAEDERWRSAGVPVPYCQNRFVGFFFMPNPSSPYSDQPPTENGGFDRVDELASLVNYELDFVTMEYAPDEDNLNPGSVLANQVGKLYQQIKENPGRYPRGLTVRILLGNYPEISNFVWGEQIYDAIADLREAGVDKMVDEEIGWRLEVANYEGTFPHSHSKFIVIDGAAVMGAGFNYGWLHYPREHPSKKGDNLYDLAMIISGPVAQDALAAYDDLWQGGNQVYCADLSSPVQEVWQVTCQQQVAQASHTPEVMKLAPAGVDGNAFSLFRNYNNKLGDDAIAAAVASAESTLDIYEVNFSLGLICVLDLLNDNVCDYENALRFMEAITTAVEEKDVKVRVMVEKSNMNGMENRVAFKEFQRELERRGLADNVELRFFKDRMHTKAVLIDDELLIVGSQNLHYSAWGERGLAEYSLASDDPRAIGMFKSMFDYFWEIAIPFESGETAAQ